MKILLDTDVCLDYMLKRKPFDIEAREIFRLLEEEKFDAYISAITPINAFYIARKEFGNEKARLEISKLIRIVEICSIHRETLEDAVNSSISDYEDAVQNESAFAENLDAIVTRNTKDFADSALKIYTPQEFLQTI